uniref:NADH dehydrogenase subunit 5 n=1 Tax=Cryptonema producta TaxID=870231 RepID=UPI002238CCC4|nr:NADH dehydrogenase subunit 5 [Cryptonema producta]UYR95073.1 NADH dehydrogenase subunit 5 [Cryptonema producta]
MARNMSLFYFSISLWFTLFLVYSGIMSGSMLVLELEISEKMLGEVGFCMVLDWVSCMFVASVAYISGCVTLFSAFYLSHETFLKRFLIILQLFVLSMMVLILFPSYLGLMVGWDGLGVVSFLLVVYYMNNSSLSAGMITAMMNRVGDVCFLLTIGLMSSCLSYGFWSAFLFVLPFQGMLLLAGSITKSAQVPFSAWLPEAMAAPTPVSTLVHSSTLVTAGVYVLIRFSDYLGEIEMFVLSSLSMLTMLLAGSSACVEVDIKKVVALSTLSQVGMMVFVVSMGANEVAFFHLLVHAFFKALMFMCVGGVIFYSGSCQDGRLLGGSWFKLPFTTSFFLFSNLSLMGFPFLSGFYSKELIISLCLHENCSMMSFMSLLVSLMLTICYSARMIKLVIEDTGSAMLFYCSVEDKYYLESMFLMGFGAVGASVLMQAFLMSFVKVTWVKTDFFYCGFILIISIFLNSLLFYMVKAKVEKTFLVFSILKMFLGSMWFLKSISGSLISSKFLTMVSKWISYVEMGLIRGYIWRLGVQNLFMTMSNNIRKINFNFVGLILFYSLCFMSLVLL